MNMRCKPEDAVNALTEIVELLKNNFHVKATTSLLDIIDAIKKHETFEVRK